MIGQKKILVTGCAGFIGFHQTKRLLSEGCDVVGLDNINDYYDVSLKKDRLSLLKEHDRFIFIQASIEDRQALLDIFKEHSLSIIIHLAAQAGVRYSMQNPQAFIDSNVVGFMNILEASREHQVEHFIYASSSSVYGANTKMPFSVHDHADHPLNIYAATKKSNELMAHSYSHLYSLPTTGLRFFTAYGPWGRPDMALFSFTKAILSGEPIKIYNHGKMTRDFTYIDDIIEGMTRLIFKKATPNPHWSGERPDPGTSYAPYKIYNIGSNQPIALLDFISILENKLNREAVKQFLPIPESDVPETYADVNDLMRDVGFKPLTPFEEGIEKFVAWYKDYYGRKA